MTHDEKIQKLLKAAGQVKSGVIHIEVKHDDDCPTLRTGRLIDCTCQPDIKKMRPN